MYFMYSLRVYFTSMCRVTEKMFRNAKIRHTLCDLSCFWWQDYVDTQMLLSSENVSQEALLCYAREAADFGTNYQLPTLDFAMNHCGQPDVAMFDFTSMHASENAALVRERFGHQLLVALVGDSLLEVRTSKLCHVKLIHFRWVLDGCSYLRSLADWEKNLNVRVCEREGSVVVVFSFFFFLFLLQDIMWVILSPPSNYINLC